MSDSINKILVVGPSWVGDMVMAQSLFISLKKNHPNCKIDVLAPAWSFPLLERMPQVSRAIEMPLLHGQFGLKLRFQIGKRLRSEEYDQSIILPNSWKSALIPFFAKIPRRTGFLGEARWRILNDARKLDKTRLTMTVQRFVALGMSKNEKQLPKYSVPEFKIETINQKKVIEQFQLSLSDKVLAICPGAEYGPAKRWPVEHFAELVKQQIAQGWSVWIFGSDKDKAVAEKINLMAANLCQDFTGKTTMAEAVDLMSLVEVVVTNDSGLMHVAAALNKKIIAIYGSSDPGFTPPLNSAAKVIDLDLDCSPCFKRQCPLGHTHCLTEILPQHVMAQID